MKPVVKDPHARKAYGFDFAENFGDGSDLEIDSVTWFIAPGAADDALEIVASSHDSTRTWVTIQGGTAGLHYTVTARVTRSDGEIDDRSLRVSIRNL